MDPNRPRAWRVLVVDDTGIHLRRPGGRDARSWAWSEVTGAAADQVRPAGAVVDHGGVCGSGLTDGSSVAFLLPSRSTRRCPAELVDEALRQIGAHRPR